MRKLFLTLFATAAVASFAAESAVGFQWYKTIGIDAEKKQSNVDAVADGPDDGSYVGVSFGQATTATWGTTSVIPEGETITTAYQRSWTVGLIDNSTGDFRWFVTSTDANISNGSLKVAATSDGGVVMTANATFNSGKGAGAPTLMNFTDTKGTKHTLTLADTPADRSPYAGVVVKFDKEGACEWTRVVGADGYESAGAFDNSVVKFSALATDASGNIYVGGVYKTALLLGNDLESRFAVNLGVKKGDKTTNNGDAFILRLNDKGEPTGLLTSTSAVPYASKESLAAITVEGNNLYVAMIVDAADDLKYNLFNVETEISADANANVVYGKVDLSTFTCTKAGALQAAATDAQPSHNAQVKNIQVAGDRLFIVGCQTGALTQDGATLIASSAKLLEDMAVSVDLSTFKASTVYKSGEASIGNTYLVIRDTEAAKVYTIAYQFNGSFAYRYEYAEDGTLNDKVVLGVGTTNFSVPTFNNTTKRLLLPVYTKGLTSFPVSYATPAGAPDATDKYAGFRGVLVSYDMPGLTQAGIAAPAADAAEADASVEYFNLQGMRVANPQAGTLVIRRQGDKVSKLIVR